MEGKHTPGPWTLDGVGGYKLIVSARGEGYITRSVCRLDSSTMSALNQIANARLIAAAPELLDAVRTGIALLAGHGKPADPAMLAAIAKATGEA